MSFLIQSFCKYAEIYGVFTKKEKRNKGYATRLIKELINLVELMNLSFIELDASIEGQPIYNKCGFIKVESEYTKMKYYL